jgi:hypothetical protein
MPFDLVSLFVLAFLRQNLSNYVCTQIIFVWLTYVFRSLDPWSVILWTSVYLCLELCCDIFPWVPVLDRACLRVWLVHDWAGGVTSWYQSRLPVGSPLPIPWPKLSLETEKTNLLTWLCGLRAHVTNWVVLGSFIPRLYSGTLISLLFGINKVYKHRHLGSRKFCLPGELDICAISLSLIWFVW